MEKFDLMGEWNVNEGTISFWVRKGKLQWNDGLIHVLFNLTKNDGSISLVRDSDNKLKFSHVISGKGRTDVEFDVSKLSSEIDHHIVTTWSTKNKETHLYVDGKSVAESKIIYASS
jgi:Concanavalin A-like lectin/glucanases superfamily